ncbi:hypothetical protein BC833DRAFT_618093 [Globomyces pollinis-pini]|nr:hypothetical protein BC833DRAFT_618093 [Globomyces pollinis-pini]
MQFQSSSQSVTSTFTSERVSHYSKNVFNEYTIDILMIGLQNLSIKASVNQDGFPEIGNEYSNVVDRDRHLYESLVCQMKKLSFNELSSHGLVTAYIDSVKVSSEAILPAEDKSASYPLRLESDPSKEKLTFKIEYGPEEPQIQPFKHLSESLDNSKSVIEQVETCVKESASVASDECEDLDSEESTSTVCEKSKWIPSTNSQSLLDENNSYLKPENFSISSIPYRNPLMLVSQPPNNIEDEWPQSPLSNTLSGSVDNSYVNITPQIQGNISSIDVGSSINEVPLDVTIDAYNNRVNNLSTKIPSQIQANRSPIDVGSNVNEVPDEVFNTIMTYLTHQNELAGNGQPSEPLEAFVNLLIENGFAQEPEETIVSEEIVLHEDDVYSWFFDTPKPNVCLSKPESSSVDYSIVEVIPPQVIKPLTTNLTLEITDPIEDHSAKLLSDPKFMNLFVCVNDQTSSSDDFFDRYIKFDY